MPDLLTTLENRWRTFAHSPRSRRTLRRWHDLEPVLGPYDTLDALTEAARDIDGDDLDHRDELHLALLRLSATDDDARYAVLHLLHPALARSARLYADTWDSDETASLIVTAALDRIARYPHGLPRPAARIVRWVRRALWKEAQRCRRRESLLDRTRSVADAETASADAGSRAVHELLDLVRLALARGVLDEPKARLIVQSRILGVPTATIAAVEGYPPSTIRQRRSRAEAAIAALATREVA